MWIGRPVPVFLRCGTRWKLWITEVKMASSLISKDSKVTWCDESTKALIYLSSEKNIQIKTLHSWLVATASASCRNILRLLIALLLKVFFIFFFFVIYFWLFLFFRFHINLPEQKSLFKSTVRRLENVNPISSTSFPGFPPTALRSEREGPWKTLVTWLQNKINSDGGVLCLTFFLSGLFATFTQWWQQPYYNYNWN